MLALSIRQPFAELILRGIKTIEYRSRATRIIGERFYLYASKTGAGSQKTGVRSDNAGIWSRDVAPAMDVPEWMIELAEQMKLIPPGMDLPRGVIVGSAVIEKCVPLPPSFLGQPQDSPLSLQTYYSWHLAGIERAKTFRKPKHHPQPVWFRPF